jgi:hypothetical protein
MQDVKVGKIDFDLAFDRVLFIGVDDLKFEWKIDFGAGNCLQLLVFSNNEWKIIR